MLTKCPVKLTHIEMDLGECFQHFFMSALSCRFHPVHAFFKPEQTRIEIRFNFVDPLVKTTDTVLVEEYPYQDCQTRNRKYKRRCNVRHC